MNSSVKEFALTTLEKNEISNLFEELSQITILLLAEGVKTDEIPNVDLFDITYHVLENFEKGRGGQMRFALNGAYFQNGRIEIRHNNLNEDTKQFFESLLLNQLSFFEKYTPHALEIFHKKGFHLLGSGKKIDEIEQKSL